MSEPSLRVQALAQASETVDGEARRQWLSVRQIERIAVETTLRLVREEVAAMPDQLPPSGLVDRDDLLGRLKGTIIP